MHDMTLHRTFTGRYVLLQAFLVQKDRDVLSIYFQYNQRAKSTEQERGYTSYVRSRYVQFCGIVVAFLAPHGGA